MSTTWYSFYRARYYDPTVGRFLSEDPIGFAAGINFYVYTHNRPTLLVDPLGLQEGWNDYKNVGNAFTVIKAKNMANEALAAAREWSKEYNLPGQHNGPPDAWRHCFWSCTMAKYLGEQVAETIADEHEKEGNKHGQPHDEELMDRANNLVGRGAACERENCWDACTDRYNQGRLFGLGAHPMIP